jgi:hypothetical protein
MRRYDRIVLFCLLVGCDSMSEESSRIIIQPVQGKMMCNAVVPALNRQVFGLGIPETIGSREQMWLVNHPDVHITWAVDLETGTVSTMWTDEAVIAYAVHLIPAEDYIDIRMSITNLSDGTWHDVFSFNCISPARAPDLKDSALVRTYMSVDGQPRALSETTRIRGHMPTVGIYLPFKHEAHIPQFAEAFKATSPDRTDGTWLATVSDTDNTYMATTSDDPLFLFNNTEFGCLHASPNFGTLEPGEEKTVFSRVYLTNGTLDDFLTRYADDN